MTDDRKTMPGDWDALIERPTEISRERSSLPPQNHDLPPALTIIASSWADLVGMLAVCTGALIAILVLGERPALPAFVWAAALGVVWWLFSAAVLVVVRQATPGMLLAGISFSEAVRPQRVVWVLVAALVGVGTFGLSGIIGGRGSALRLAAAAAVVEGAA
ncbi:MAG: hypothetical protein OEV48_00995 [Acidobacteriota bacterium]|jgi:hypothetical protein|nr:hypothetical protein [Acidobacteriota bacterium]